MRMDKMTVKAQEAFTGAQALAAEKGNAQIAPLHMLREMISQEGGFIAGLLEKVGIPRERILTVIDAEIDRIPTQSSNGTMNTMRRLYRSAPRTSPCSR